MSVAGRSPASGSFNLSKAFVLLVDSEATSLDVLSRIFNGFGVGAPRKCMSAARARECLRVETFDLVITDGRLSDESGYDFVQWLRRSGIASNFAAPVLILSGHTPQDEIDRARDCGANLVIAKPFTPEILLERILWLARSPRSFVESDAYLGPDRRVRNLGPPIGSSGRRAGDLSAEIGEAAGENLGQKDIDMLLPTPMRVQL